jgi:serine/threonine protein kinase
MEAAAAPTEPSPARRQPLPSLPAIAEAFPNLEILEWIGQGGMGAVYKARQPKLNRFVALKILPESLGRDPAFAERFLREGQMLARLNHPNIVTVHDFGEAEGYFYLLMEFVDGVNLRQAMRAGRFTAGQALAIVPKICEALQFAHDEGVLHRDIKPENILLDIKGRVKLVDFGIAKLVGGAETRFEPTTADGSGVLTQSGAALGTPNYMAPEQITQPSGVDHRADIYSLGVVFYELLTGELPKEGFSAPSMRVPVTPDIDAIVLRALEKERARRQQSASELKTEVETLVSNAVSKSGSPSSPEPPVMTAAQAKPDATAPFQSMGRRRSLLRRLGVAVLVVLAIVIPLRMGRVMLATRPPASTQPPSATPAPALAPIVKVIELDRGWVQTNAAAVSVMSRSELRPDESVLAGIRFSDGRPSPASSAIYVLKRGHAYQSTLSFSWHFPEAFGLEYQEGAWESIRSNHLHRPLHLVAGQPMEIFSVTNRFGGTLTGFIEYQVVSREELSRSQAALPVRATIRVKPKAAMPQWLAADYAVVVPAGYRVQGSCAGSAMNDGEANTQLYPGSSTLNSSCTWFIRGDFKPEHLQQAAQQMELIRSRGAIEVRVGQPARLFSITNGLGETFDGLLELVGPEDNEAAKVAAVAPPERAITTVQGNASGAGSPTDASMRSLAQRIGEGDPAAFDELQEISQSLYRNINYATDRERTVTNLALMSAAYETLGRAIAAGNEASFEAVRRSLASRHLRSFAPRALGIAAAAGHQESLDMLLNYSESGILLSSVVSALQPAAARTNEPAIQFLIRVLDERSNKALWYLASEGLRPAAAAGHVDAKTALQTYDKSKGR